MARGVWTTKERLGWDPEGEWLAAERSVSGYRDVSEPGLLWRQRGKPSGWGIDEDLWVAELVPSFFQQVVGNGAAPVPYFVLEWIEGVSLRALLTQARGLEAALAVGLALCDAIIELHAVRRHDQVLDLRARGLSLDTLWMSGPRLRAHNPLVYRLVPPPDRRAGAQAFDCMPPELVRGDAEQAATDVFRIALLTLTMAIGRSPFLRSSQFETLSAARDVDLVGELEVLPTPVRTALEWAFHSVPQKRPSARQLARELKRAAEECGVVPELQVLERAAAALPPGVCGIPL
jgi:hypothetical protein